MGWGEVGDLADSIPLNNFLIIKAITMRLGGLIVRPKTFSLRFKQRELMASYDLIIT